METSPGLGFLTGEDFLALPQKQRQWIIEPIIPAKGIVNLYGKPKTGKSFASFGMGLAIANGLEEWNGFPVRTHGKVAYLQIDTPEGEMFDRINTVKQAGYDVSKLLFADMTTAPYPFNVLLPQHHQWLEQQMAIHQPVMVFIDTLREAHEVDENDSTDMKRVINTLVKVCRPAAIGLISHSRKDTQWSAMGGGDDIMDEARGSSYVPGRMDTIIKFTGKNRKGHMEFKGRSKGAEGRIPIMQDAETGLVFLEGSHAALEQEVLKVLREHPELSQNKQAEKVQRAIKDVSIATIKRRIRDLKGGSKVDFDPDPPLNAG